MCIQMNTQYNVVRSITEIPSVTERPPSPVDNLVCRQCMLFLLQFGMYSDCCQAIFELLLLTFVLD